MIKFPKEVTEIINRLSSKGFECYAVGGCVRDSMLGLRPLDWDLSTSAKIEDLKEIFKEAKVLSEQFGVIRIDFTTSEDDDKNPIVDIATYRKEGEYKEYGKPSNVTFVDDINEDLNRRDFTINAMADNPQKGFVDPFDGKKDLNERIIRTIGNPVERFKDDPIRMLRAIRFVSEKRFVIDDETYNAIKENIGLLKNISVDKIRREFEGIVEGRFVAEGLRIFRDVKAFGIITGNNDGMVSIKKKDLFNRLLRNINDTYPSLERRLGLIYGSFGRENAKKAIEFLNYSEDVKIHLYDAVYSMERLGAIKDDFELKDFIYEYGYERYAYMEKLAQDKVVVYKGTARKVNKRKDMFDRFISRNEPIFLEDLVIDGKDIKEELGIEGEKIGEILNVLVIEVHRKPTANNRQTLIELAKKYNKSSLKMKVRTNSWLKRLK